MDTTSPTYPVIATIPVGDNPAGMAITPDGAKLYVADYGSTTVEVINTSTTIVTTRIALPTNPGGPYNMVMSPNGGRLYVTSGSTSTLATIDTTTDSLLSTTTIPSLAGGLAISPDGNRVYVANNQLGLTVYDASTNSVLTTIPGSGRDILLTSNSTGTRVYASNEDNPGKVDVFDTTSNTLVTTIPVNIGPSGIDILANDSRVYVADDNGGNTVSVIDTATNTMVDTIPVGSDPLALVIEKPQPLYHICPLYDQTKAVHSGATISIKLELCDAQGNDLSSSAITVTAKSVIQTSTNAPGQLESPGNANPDNNFRFDATLGTTGGYIYNLSTKEFTTGTYALNFTAGTDPTLYAVQFEVK